MSKIISISCYPKNKGRKYCALIEKDNGKKTTVWGWSERDLSKKINKTK